MSVVLLSVSWVLFSWGISGFSFSSIVYGVFRGFRGVSGLSGVLSGVSRRGCKGVFRLGVRVSQFAR